MGRAAKAGGPRMVKPSRGDMSSRHTPLSGSTLNWVRWVGLGRPSVYFWKLKGLELGHVDDHLQAQVDGKMGRQRADELLVTEPDLAQFAAGQEGGLAKVAGWTSSFLMRPCPRA